MENKDLDKALKDLNEKMQPVIDQLNQKLAEFGEAMKPYVEAVHRNMENLRNDLKKISERDT